MERLMVLILLCSALALTHGYCYRAQLQRISKFGPRNKCIDEIDNKIYNLGSKWQNSQCETCLCMNDAMSCCETSGECY